MPYNGITDNILPGSEDWLCQIFSKKESSKLLAVRQHINVVVIIVVVVKYGAAYAYWRQGLFRGGTLGEAQLHIVWN